MSITFGVMQTVAQGEGRVTRALTLPVAQFKKD